MSRREPVQLGELVEDLVRRTREDSVDPLRRIEAAWSELAARIEGTADTRVAGFSRGVVSIEVKSPPLCAELAQFRRLRVLTDLRSAVGDTVKVKDVRFRLGAW